jgi:hypothetical protein
MSRDIYLAGRWDRQEELRGYRIELRRRGHIVNARWLDQYDTIDLEKLGRKDVSDFASDQALVDIADIVSCDLFLAFTGGGGSGGRHVEFGMALWMEKEIVMIGPLENIFQCLPQVTWYKNWPTFLRDGGMGYPK